jgi:excisionase family DNA binding protein
MAGWRVAGGPADDVPGWAGLEGGETMQQEWLTLSEAAERLGISVQTARRWARDGKLRAEQHQGARGAEYRVPADALPAAAPHAAAPSSPALGVPNAASEDAVPPALAPSAPTAVSEDAVPTAPAPALSTAEPPDAVPTVPASSAPSAAPVDALPAVLPPPLPSAEAVELAAGLGSLRPEVRSSTREQAARENVLRAELEKTRTELSAALEALRQTRETVADLHRQLEDRDKLLEGKTRALVAARRQVAARESGRLNVLRENLQEGQRPWWRRLKGKEGKEKE